MFLKLILTFEFLCQICNKDTFIVDCFRKAFSKTFLMKTEELS